MSEHQAATSHAFVPEAHLPRERRLVISSTGVLLETGLGIRHQLTWWGCHAVMVWPDRAELVLDDDVSLVVRASDWHHGDAALRAIRERAPASVLVGMPDDPEPQPVQHVLHGLAASSSAVLVCLFLSLALVAAIGIGVGVQDRRAAALTIGFAFALGALGTLQALVTRLNVPMRWREAASVRGRAGVTIDSYLASASDRTLAVVEPALYLLAGVSAGVLVAMREFNLLPSSLLLGLAVATSVERALRRRRP